MALKKKGTPEKIKVVKESEVKESIFVYPPFSEDTLEPKSKKKEKK